MSLQISGHTGLLGFFADPAAHSKSPFMYNTAFQKLGMDYVYLAFQIDQTSLADAIRSMRTLQMRGANVSMPNKTAVGDQKIRKPSGRYSKPEIGRAHV